jgi:hypothetical protein
MYYKIAAKTNLFGEGVVHAWYSGRKTGEPRFEAEVTHDEVLRYYFYENAKDDKVFLEKMPQLCQDVEIVAFDEDGQAFDDDSEPKTSTVELEQQSPLEILQDAQQILTQVVAPGQYADISPEKSHEQTRMALNLVLKAINILEKNE